MSARRGGTYVVALDTVSGGLHNRRFHTSAEVRWAMQNAGVSTLRKDAEIYEIYPRRFADTTGDGIGDLNGVTAHLDYLKNVGVNAIWIAPFYPSPVVDVAPTRHNKLAAGAERA